MNCGVNFVVTITTSLSKNHANFICAVFQWDNMLRFHPFNLAMLSSLAIFKYIQGQYYHIMNALEVEEVFKDHSITALIRDFPFANISCIFFTSKNQYNMYIVFWIIYESFGFSEIVYLKMMIKYMILLPDMTKKA